MDVQRIIGRNAFAGLFVAGLGGGVLLLSWHYPSGTLSDIGPGVVVQTAAAAMLALGSVMFVHAVKQRTGSEAAADDHVRIRSWRPFIIPAAMALFALLLSVAGLALTAAVSAFVASYGSRSLTMRERLSCALVLAAFVTLLFGYGLRIQILIWPGYTLP